MILPNFARNVFKRPSYWYSNHTSNIAFTMCLSVCSNLRMSRSRFCVEIRLLLHCSGFLGLKLGHLKTVSDKSWQYYLELIHDLATLILL